MKLDGLRIKRRRTIRARSLYIHGTDQNLAEKYPIVIREIRADDALLVILRKPTDQGKPPHEFAIHQLIMRDFNFEGPASFHALLTNPVPTGEINCDGKFGPGRRTIREARPWRRIHVSQRGHGHAEGTRGTLSSDGNSADHSITWP